MKEKFREVKLSKPNLELLNLINSIIKEYQADGYVLTLRQLYYQLVSRDVIPNKQREYAKISNLLKEGRMSGIVDWNAIEDRLRFPKKPPSWDNPKDIVESAAEQFALDRMEGQENYIEVWVEKDALSGVLSRITNKYHIRLMVNRGYSSVSAMYDAYKRFSQNRQNIDSPVYVIYLGDFDPSGLDMIRDIDERINEFDKGFDGGLWHDDFNFTVKPVALTMDQIEEYNPPPNPAKISDPRAKDFIKKYGGTSWEVDALKPNVLNSILEGTILSLIDVDKYNEIVKKEQGMKKDIKNLTKYLKV